MSEPLVTVITPTYNHVRFIEGCVRSVLGQTYPRWEMAVVDDASADGTADAVRAFAAVDPRIRLIAHARRRGAEGLADSYNEALRASRGDLVAILEGDDWWAPDRLARQVPLLVNDPSLVLAYGDCWEVSESGRPIGHVATRISRTSARSTAPEALTHFAGLGSLPAQTVLIRREALERAGGFQSGGLPLVDYPTFLTLSLSGDLVRVPEPLACWRRHPGSVYWRNLARIGTGCHGFFGRFVAGHREAIRSLGLDPEALVRSADGALARMLASLPYFDAKYELLCGDRARARRKLLRAVVDPRTSIRHRLAGLLGVAASLSSPELFTAALAVRRPRVAGGRELLPQGGARP